MKKSALENFGILCSVSVVRIVISGAIMALVSLYGNAQDSISPRSSFTLIDPKGYFNIGTTTIRLPNGNSYATDTIGKVCSLAELSPYGGWKKRSHTATGFFYAKETEGNWHLVDPMGYEFIIMSVVSVEKGGPVSLPGDLKANMINSMGNWSDLTIPDIPVCPRFNFLQEFKNTNNNLKDLFDQNIFPVFDPGYESFCDLRANFFVSEFKADPWVIGYFTDNELPFHKVILDDYLALSQSNANYKAAHEWMVSRQGEGYVITDTDRDAFRGYVAHRYAEPIYQGLKKYDPNHMILGPRLHASAKFDPFILEGLGSFVDVLGINYYSRWDTDKASMDLWLEKTGKPFLITEFYTKGMDTGLPNDSGAGWEVYTQQDRAWFFENFVLQLMSHPGSVGWQWFRYIDHYGVNKGIISETYMWYSELLASMRKVGKDVYNLRRFMLGLDYDPVWDPACTNLSVEKNIQASHEYQIFPNPASKMIRIKVLHSQEKNITVSIYNSLAQLVSRSEYPPSAEGAVISINTEQYGLNPGYHTLQINNGRSVQREVVVLF